MPTIGIKFIKKDDKLVPLNIKENEKFKAIKESIKNNEVLNAIFDFGENSGTRTQVQHIYSMINIIAKESMMDVETVKTEVKLKSGFFKIENGVKTLLSFSNPENLTYESLQRVIEYLYELGDFLNINLKKQF